MKTNIEITISNIQVNHSGWFSFDYSVVVDWELEKCNEEYTGTWNNQPLDKFQDILEKFYARQIVLWILAEDLI